LIKSPVLILTGEDDPEHPPEFARQMHERIQSSSLFIISGVGVPTYREKEQETLEILSSEISAWCLKWR
jgi:pimeloyl-ACP methyl ester carboxylesterase